MNVAVEHVLALAGERPDAPALVLMGRGGYRPPASARGRVVELGYVDDEAKRAVYAGALALVNPSEMESLSLVLMEAWLEGTPAIVAAGSEVMADHVARSGGGMTFASYGDFRAAVARLLDEPGRARAHGRAGAGVRARRVRLAGGLGAPRGGGRTAGRLMRVHQLIAAAAPGDAVTDQALAWQGILREWGVEGLVIAEHVHPALEGRPGGPTAARPSCAGPRGWCCTTRCGAGSSTTLSPRRRRWPSATTTSPRATSCARGTRRWPTPATAGGRRCRGWPGGPPR